ncbi:polysaccharide lyase family 8 super-sandwich domain-containing protein [Streptomyces sp. NPDC050560]|uniref:polysaccharide lyase family 8 super-sandwich domain-containing protein n=1 Tax=Streptomyces sp. NPDC050560 TaxID=3365630 RepID=UPI003793B4A9
MPLSRRALLSTVPAAALLAAAAPLRARAADGAPAADPGSDAERVAANALADLTGTDESNARPEVAAKLAAVEDTAYSRLAAMDAAGSGEIFSGLALGSDDAKLTTTCQYLYEIALATRTPGPAASDLRDNAAVQRRVVDALATLHTAYYGDQSTGYYGNWFNWEIGISQHVSRTLLLLAAQLAAAQPELTAAYIASMDGYLRNGKDGDVDLDSRFHTGANLADITTNRILQGAVTGDAARITKAVADQLTVLARIDPYHLSHGVTDGFYADGSFLQHASVAYTGSYGTGLLSRVTGTVKLLDGTDYATPDEIAGVARGWLSDAFAPVIYEGWMMEIVKGRGVSRTGTGYADTATVVEAVVDLSAYAEGDDAAALRNYAAHIAATAKAPLDPAAFASPVTVARYADIAADPATVPRDLVPTSSTHALNAMERTVHRRPGYAFALARSSTRVSKYEYMSGENLMPWFQGEGAHYLYLSGQDQSTAYGVDHYTAVSPYRLGGVTAPVETRRTVPELYGTQWYDNPDAGFTSSSESQNTYVYFPRATRPHSGGAVLGRFATAALVQSDDAAYAAARAGELPADFVAYRGADATKSWFLLDDEIVVLAAGVGDGAGRGTTTTVDTRIAAPDAAVSLTGRLRDGRRFSGTGTAPLAWLRYGDGTHALGYVFLDGTHRPTVRLDTVTRSRRAVRAANPDTAVTKQVFSVGHEQAPGARHIALAHALVPHADEKRLRRYAHGPLAVLANSPRMQAIRHRTLGLLAVNTFAHGTHRVGELALEGPASALVRTGGDGTVTLALSDPTTQRATVTAVLRGRARRVVAADDGVRVRGTAGGVRVEATTHQTYGATLTVTLR